MRGNNNNNNNWSQRSTTTRRRRCCCITTPPPPRVEPGSRVGVERRRGKNRHRGYDRSAASRSRGARGKRFVRDGKKTRAYPSLRNNANGTITLLSCRVVDRRRCHRHRVVRHPRKRPRNGFFLLVLDNRGLRKIIQDKPYLLEIGNCKLYSISSWELRFGCLRL